MMDRHRIKNDESDKIKIGKFHGRNYVE